MNHILMLLYKHHLEALIWHLTFRESCIYTSLGIHRNMSFVYFGIAYNPCSMCAVNEKINKGLCMQGKGARSSYTYGRRGSVDGLIKRINQAPRIAVFPVCY